MLQMLLIRLHSKTLQQRKQSPISRTLAGGHLNTHLRSTLPVRFRPQDLHRKSVSKTLLIQSSGQKSSLLLLTNGSPSTLSSVTRLISHALASSHLPPTGSTACHMSLPLKTTPPPVMLLADTPDNIIRRHASYELRARKAGTSGGSGPAMYSSDAYSDARQRAFEKLAIVSVVEGSCCGV